MSGRRKPELDGRSLPVVRAIAFGLALASFAALAGCGSDRRLYEEAVIEAESGMASSVERTVAQTTDLLTHRAAVSGISADDIVVVFLIDARGYESGPLDAVKTSALFDLAENADGSVTFSVFLKTSVYRASGLSSTTLTRYSCGAITGRFGEGVLSLSDLDCPSELAATAGEDSRPLSMTKNAAKYGVNVGTAP